MKKIFKRKNCRICRGKNLAKILDLGKMPPANSFFKNSGESKEKFPLAVYFCKNCKLLQLLHVVNHEILFKNYVYFTSASRPLVEHFEKMAESLANRFISSDRDLFVEIGGNDGVLLDKVKYKCKVLNIEPARNVAAASLAKGIETIQDYFTASLADKILRKYGPVKVITANNVLAHIDNIREVFKGVKKMLSPEGAFVFEVHWVGNLLSEGGFDQIYHEHLCYYSLHALQHLAHSTGLNIFDVELQPIHGASLRIYASHDRPQGESVKKFMDQEKTMGLDKPATFLKFKTKVNKNKKELIKLIASIKKNGGSVVGYGAPAKGNTLLNYCGFNKAHVDFIVDTTPAKQGLLAPGSGIPVLHPDRLYESRPDYVLLLAWNYASDILQKEAELRKRGIKFILPVPKPRIV